MTDKTKSNGGIIYVESVFPDIYTRKELNKINAKCCDYPDWNDTLLDAEGEPYISCNNCGAMCFE